MMWQVSTDMYSRQALSYVQGDIYFSINYFGKTMISIQMSISVGIDSDILKRWSNTEQFK